MISTTATQDQVQLRLLKVFAEMSTYCDAFEENAATRIENVYTVLRVSFIFVYQISQNNIMLLGIHACS